MAAATGASESFMDRMSMYQVKVKQFPHLKEYLDRFVAKGYPAPDFHIQLNSDMSKLATFNFLYPVTDPVFIHVWTDPQVGGKYNVIEPVMDDILEKKFDAINELILRQAPYEPTHETKKEFEKVLEHMLQKVTTFKEPKKALFSSWEFTPVQVTREELEVIRYYLKRNILNNGPLEPLILDPYLEDIHSVGVEEIYIVHKLFRMMQTNVKFGTLEALDNYLRAMSERIGKPVSDSKPIIDGSMPDGSRINIVYSEDVSRRGSSFTIRKFTAKPITITQLISFGTFSPQLAAYCWLALENGMNIIVSGETASGKTTSLNALLTFVNHNKKVYTAEDTPEVIAPQKVWQRLVTRDTGPVESRVELFDLVRTALRSRPDYIIVGETRGREGAMMFQAMQTGHAVISTFHAPSTTQMIQRFTGEPINVPIRFLDNLNIALFQQILYEEGRLIRRVTSVDEIIRYSKELQGVMIRSVFKWDPFTDTHYFRGMNNSFILEEKIAPRLKYEDRRMIYDELLKRERILKNMVDHHIFEYDDVNKVMKAYYSGGYQAMPPELLV